VAAAMAVRSNQPMRSLDVAILQRRLLEQGAVLIYYRDIEPTHPAFKAVQFYGVRGAIPDWYARADDPVTAEDVERWTAIAGQGLDEVRIGIDTRGQVLQRLYERSGPTLR